MRKREETVERERVRMMKMKMKMKMKILVFGKSVFLKKNKSV